MGRADPQELHIDHNLLEWACKSLQVHNEVRGFEGPHPQPSTTWRQPVALLDWSQLIPVWAKLSHGSSLRDNGNRTKVNACAALGVSSGISS